MIIYCRLTQTNYKSKASSVYNQVSKNNIFVIVNISQENFPRLKNYLKFISNIRNDN